MADRSNLLLIGNSLAVLIAAYELTQRGRPVTLLTDGKQLGGHFAGATIEGHGFDVGMVMLERPAASGTAGGSIDYRGDIRNDWTRFAPEVAGWMDTRLDLRRAPTPTVQVEGRSGPDYLIANRLDLIAGTQSGAEAPPSLGDPSHASHKTTSTAYEGMSYAEAARMHHGDAWHARYIEPFVYKLLDTTSSAFLARYHRAGWVPLYYPETLDAARRGEATGLPEYPFYTLASGFVGSAVAQMAAAVVQAPGSQVVRAPVQGLQRDGSGWHAWTEEGRVSAASLALGLAPERCHGLLGLPPVEPLQAASVALMFALVRGSAIRRPLGCHMVLDDDYSAYRLCDQDHLAGLDPDWHRVVIEASPRALADKAGSDDPAAARSVLAEELRRLMALPSDDDVRPLKNMLARNALVLPTREAITCSALTPLALSKAAPGAHLTGTLLGYGVASFNDQVVQGLQIAQDFA